MNSEWLKRLSFFVDPKLKNFDKELYRVILQDLDSAGIPWFEDLQVFPVDPVLPAAYFLLPDTVLNPAIRSKDKTFLLGGSTMSLFGKKEFAGENVWINSVADWKATFASLPLRFDEGIRAAEEKLLEDSLGLFKKLVKRNNQLDFSNVKDVFLEIEEALLASLTLEEAQARLAKFSEESERFNFYLLPSWRVYGKFAASIPFQAGEENWHLCWQDSEKDGAEALYVYSILEDILNRGSKKREKKMELEDMQRILSELPVPLALFNGNNELALHNALFIQLNLTAKACLGLRDDQQFQQGDELYRAKKIILAEKSYTLFYFIPIKEFLGKSASPSSEELGIVSSSIAHELNNPLGGISGALDVILLDDHPSEVEQGLKEMKAGVARCKKLVETFLGFSKLNARNLDPEGDSHNMESSFHSAIELIRFRLIENNVSLETRFEQRGRYGLEYNPHVMSMIIYLVLGDLLTGYGHQKLVGGERSAVFSFGLREEKDSIKIFISEGMKLGKEFLSSKLLNHLLEIQNLRIEPNPESIELRAL